MIVRGLMEARSRADYIADWLSGVGDYFTSGSGENVTQASAMTLSAWFDGINTYSDDIAKLPMHVFRRGSNEDRFPDYNHPSYWLIARQPNQRQDPFSLMKWLEVKRINWGNGYAYVSTDFNGYPNELIPLPPEYTVPYIAEDGSLWYVLSVPGLSLCKLPASEVIHVKGFSEDGISGNSLIGYAREVLGAARAEQKFEGNFYRQGLKLGGILETPGKIDPDGKDLIRNEFERMTSGLSNMHRVAVLDMGLKFTKLEMPLKDAQYIETRQMSIADQSRFLKMPLFKLQEGKQAYNSNEQQSISYLVDSLDPILVQYEQQFGLKLFSRREQKKYYVRFNRAALLRADLAARKAFLEGMIQNGIYTISEARAFEELNRYESGAENPADRLLISRNYAFLEDLNKIVGQPVTPQTVRTDA